MFNIVRHYHTHNHQPADPEARRQLNRIERLLEKVMHTIQETLALVTDEGSQVDALVAFAKDQQARLNEALAGKLSPTDQAAVDAIFDRVTKSRQNATDVMNAINSGTAAHGVDPTATAGANSDPTQGQSSAAPAGDPNAPPAGQVPSSGQAAAPVDPNPPGTSAADIMPKPAD
jgi:hypothetical protein